MAVSIARRGSSVAVSPPRALFLFPAPLWYEPSPDGTRFLLRKVVSPESPLTIVLNWKAPR